MEWRQAAPATPGTGEPRTGLSMGEHQALTTAEWGITRAEQDELAAKSHQNLARAYDEGFFSDLVTPFKGVTRDTNLRADSTAEKLGKLKPVFGRGLEAEPTMTAGNSTPLTDGASAVLISSEEWAAERGLTVLADVVDVESAAVDFVHGDEGLLMAPAYATPRILARQGLTFEDIDFFEIHEAFASQALACLRGLGLPDDAEHVNPNGGAIALGHPLGMSGARIAGSVALQLARTGGRLGLATMCVGVGQGVALAVERVG